MPLATDKSPPCSFAATAGFIAVALVACGDDLRYLQPPNASVTVNAGNTGDTAAAARVTLPIRPETTREADERAGAARSLGVAPGDIPFVRLGDLALSVEWTVHNRADSAGIFRVDLVAANEWWRYVPELFDLDPNDNEDTPPPPLVDGRPLRIGARETVSGVIREDQLVEAAIDLELMSRGAYDVVVALINRHEDLREFVDASSQATMPRRLFAGVVELEVRFSATTNMELQYALRVRDRRGLLHKRLLGAAPSALTLFEPQDINGPPDAP